MEEEVREILAKLDTQLDGIESYMKRLIEIGEANAGDKFNKENLWRLCRVNPRLDLDVHMAHIRRDMQQIKDTLNMI